VVGEVEAGAEVLAGPEITTSFTSRWYSSDSRAALISCIISTDSTLAGGRFRVMRARPPSTWKEISR